MGGITTTLFQRPRDPQFNNTTLLLSGNFPTNGAQNNTFLDSSSNGFSITRNGNTTQGSFSPFSQTGWSNYFPGGNGKYIYAPYNAVFDFGTGDFSVECFAYVTDAGRRFDSNKYGTFVSGGNTVSLSSLWTFGFLISSGVINQLTFSVNGSDVLTASSQSISLNAWHHFVVCRTGTTLSIYVDGTRVATATYSSAVNTNSSGAVFISQAAYQDVYENWLIGNISNVRIIKGTQPYNAANSSITVPTAQLTNITNTSLLTCLSNRFIDTGTANGGNPFTITIIGTGMSVQPFSPFVPSGAYTTTAVGGSGYFDGTSDYLTAPSGASISGSGAFTCEFWYYMTVSQNDRYIMAGGTDTFSVGVSGNGNMFYGKSGVGNVYAGSGLPTSINQWVHVVIGKNSSGTYRIWANGASISTGSDSFTYTAGTAYVGISAALTNPITGYITGLRTASVDIYGVSNTTITVPTAPRTNTSNTQLLLNFTNAGIVDSTAKNVLETVGNAQISTAVSRFGGTSMYFDGAGDYLSYTAGSPAFNLSTGDWTIEAWIYRNASGVAHQIINLFNSAGANSGLSFYVNSSNQLAQDNGVTATTAAGTVPANAWTHVAAVRNSGNTQLYINGVAVGSAITQAPNTAQFFRVGITALDQAPMNGYIDDLRITRGVARYTANFNVPTIGFTDR